MGAPAEDIAEYVEIKPEQVEVFEEETPRKIDVECIEQAEKGE
jgi:hypothetical protein